VKVADEIAVCVEPFAFSAPPLPVTVNGVPLILLMIGLMSQPPRIQLPTPDFAQRCPFPKRQSQHTPNLDVVGAVVTGQRSVLLPERRVRESEET
jgi:hypothetical protein